MLSLKASLLDTPCTSALWCQVGVAVGTPFLSVASGPEKHRAFCPPSEGCALPVGGFRLSMTARRPSLFSPLQYKGSRLATAFSVASACWADDCIHQGKFAWDYWDGRESEATLGLFQNRECKGQDAADLELSSKIGFFPAETIFPSAQGLPFPDPTAKS